MTNPAPDFDYVVLLDTLGQPYKASGTGGTSMTDDGTFTAGSSSFVPVGGIVTADSVDSGDGGAFAMLANRQQKITLYDSSGVEVTSFGGGTQYTEGDTDASITGPALMWEDAGDTLRAVSAAKPLPVSDAGGNLSIDDGGNVITVDGSGSAGSAAAGVVTVQGIASMTPVQVSQATAGNLNMTEASGAAIKTAVELIDDGVYVDDTATHATGTSKGYGMMAVATPTDSAVDANDFGHLAMSTTRRLHTSVQDFAGTAPVTGSGTATGALRVELPTNGTGVLATVGTVSTVTSVTQVRPPDIDVTGHTNYARKYYTSTGAATDGIIWSPASGKRWHITSLIFQVSADATVTFEDDKAGGDDPVLKGEFKAGSGLALTFDEKYPFASGEDAADFMVTTSAGNIYVACVGYEI